MFQLEEVSECVLYLANHDDATHGFAVKLRKGRETKTVHLFTIGDGLGVILPAIRQFYGIKWQYIGSELIWETSF